MVTELVTCMLIKKRKLVLDKGGESATHSHRSVKKLRNHRIIGDLITITFYPRINLRRHILLVNITLRLSTTAGDEGYNFKDKTVVNSSIVKLDGVELNNHVAVFRGELHDNEKEKC